MLSNHFSIDNQLQITKNKIKTDEIKKTNKNNDNLLLAKSTNLGYYLITPILIGVFFGVGLDQFLGTKPLFTISLLIIGVIGTFYNLVKFMRDATH